jgi:hypothetical protein
MADNDNNDKIDQIIPELLAKSLKIVNGGAIDIDMERQSALRIEIDKNEERISINFIHPTIIHIPELLKTAKEFSHQLTDNGLTLSFLRKGKEAITLGKKAHPTLSKLITRSDDIQVDSVRESIKLGRDLKK